MKKYLSENERGIVVFMSLYLLIYTILSQTHTPYEILIVLFTASQIGVPYMAWRIIKHGIAPKRELGTKEFGYIDREDL